MTTPADKNHIERIQYVAFQLDVMAAGAPPKGGLAKMLTEMALDLNIALEQMGEKTAESMNQRAQRALAAVGLYNIKPLFIGLVLEGHSDIGQLADRWGWSDTEVRDQLCRHLVCDMLGITEREYLQQMSVNEAGLMGRFHEAHERWS